MVASSVASKTLAVNPAFLQEIKDSNPDLWDAIHRLRQICECEQSPAQTARGLARTLDALRDHLSLQFSLEESYGYLELTAASSKPLGELATQAHSQHCTLYLALSELAEQAEELQYRGVEAEQLRKLIHAVQKFDTQLRKHEQLENELIERSFDSA